MNSINGFLKLLVIGCLLGGAIANYYEDSGSLPQLSYKQIIEFEELLKSTNLLTEGFKEKEWTQCKKHVLSIMFSLGQGWALQMLDSNAVLYGGILKANHEFLGQYDECLDVESPKNFTGQHCLLRGSLNGVSFPGIPADQELVFFYGLCLPSTCSPEQITKAFNWIGKKTKGVLTLEADEKLCHTKEEPPIEDKDVVVMKTPDNRQDMLMSKRSTLAKLAMNLQGCRAKACPKQCMKCTLTCRLIEVIGGRRYDFCGIKAYEKQKKKKKKVFLSLIGALAVFSTVYDLYKQNKLETPVPVLASFSLYSNGKSLFQVTSNSGQMECINGLRVFSMMWIVFFHTFTTFIAAPAVNVIDAYGARHKPLYGFLINAYLAVDTFFLISGLLVSMSFMRAMKRPGNFDVPSSYIKRYLRITPSYGMILLFQLTVFTYIGSGPLWNMILSSQTKPCSQYWWTGLLYVQNFVNPTELCLIQTWYLSADMQMFWLSPILLYPLYLWPKFGVSLLGFAIGFFTAVPLVISYLEGFAPVPLWDTTNKQNWLDNYPTYSRATPYLVGLAVGYLICVIQWHKYKVKLSKITAVCGWIIAFTVGALCTFGIISFMNDESYVPGEQSIAAALFLSLHRLGWALALSWLILACIYNYGGPINTFLSWGAFQCLGKLSFGVYLSHISIILYRIGVLKTNVHFNLNELFFMFCEIWLIAHAVSVLLFLFVEAPIGVLDKHYLRKMKIFPLPRPRPTSTPKVEQGKV